MSLNYTYMGRAALASLALLTSAFAMTAQAQSSEIISTAGPTTAAPEGCLRLTDVLELAGRRDPSVLIARAGEDEADADIDQARSLYRPRLDAVSRTGVGSTGVVDSGVSNSIGFRASQRLIDFGDAKYARRSARADFAAAQYDTRQAALDAATQAGFAFLEYHEAIAQVELTERRRDYFSRQLDSIDKLLETGGATRTERASVASQLSEAEGFVLELEFRRDRARTQIELATRASSPICKISDSSDLSLATTYLVAVFDQEQQLREDVSITWQRLNSLEKQLATRTEVERQTQLQFEAAEIEAGVGTITYRDLVELRLEFEAAGLARIQTTFDLEQQKLVLRSLTGQA